MGDVLGAHEEIELPHLVEVVTAAARGHRAQKRGAARGQHEAGGGGRCAASSGRSRLHSTSNAIPRYNKPGGAEAVTCGASRAGAVRARGRHGHGIAPEEQGKVFERFYRVDKSRSKSRRQHGTRPPTIVKHAALCGARIDLASEVGQGTTVTVTFPKV